MSSAAIRYAYHYYILSNCSQVLRILGIFRAKHGLPATLTLHPSESYFFAYKFRDVMNMEVSPQLLEKGIVGYIFGVTVKLDPDQPQNTMSISTVS